MQVSAILVIITRQYYIEALVSYSTYPSSYDTNNLFILQIYILFYKFQIPIFLLFYQILISYIIFLFSQYLKLLTTNFQFS